MSASLGPVRPRAVLMRAVSPRWSAALREHHDGALDYGAARTQHGAYALALFELGIRVVMLSPGPEPDGCFTEDTAIVIGRHALATRPAAVSRRPEVLPVVRALAKLGCIVHRMGPPATLEGGDVLRIGDTLLVGRSRRTNDAGVAALARLAVLEGLVVQPVDIGDQMHLKGAVTLASHDTAVVDPTALDPAIIADLGVSVLAVDEPVGANVLALGDGVVLVPGQAPRTAAALRARGLRTIALDGSELSRADGRLTCLSLRLPPVGAWCA